MPHKKRKPPPFSFKHWLKTSNGKLLFLALLIAIAYINSLNSEFVSDDVWGILNNQKMGQLSFITDKAPLILQPTLFFIVNQIFGKLPIAYRTLNIAFHLGAVWLLYFIVSRLINWRTALVAATLLAIHPIQAESVVWISGGPYAWYSFFLLGAFATYLLSEQGRPWEIVSNISFVFALFVSPIATIWPAILFVYLLIFKKVRKDWKKLIIPSMLALLWLGIFAMQISSKEVLMQTMLGTETQITTIQKILRIPVAITSYWELILWPKALTFYHSEFTMTKLELAARVAVVISVLTFTAFMLVKLLRQNKSNLRGWRKTAHPQFVFWTILFFIGIAPTLTPFLVASLVAERYVYFAAIGIYVLAGIALTTLIRKFKKYELWITAAACIAVILLVGRTVVRTEDWKTADSLWIAAAKTSPHSHQNHNNLGDLFTRRGEYDRAIQEFETSLKLAPRFAPAYYNMANVYLITEDYGKAEENYLKSIEYDPSRPDVYTNLAIVLSKQGREEEARQLLDKANQLQK